jgi:muramoyltetrapeptide carboxypeptidase
MVASTSPSFPETMIKPPVVRPGDRVGMIAPASPLGPGEVERGVAHMRKLGLVPVLGEAVREHYGYLAGDDDARLADFNRMLRDPDIDAIVALRGGYGTMRILEHLDYAALRARPKVVMGFSDLTAPLNALAQRSGVITFHGPVASRESSFAEGTLEFIRRAWMQTAPIGTLYAPKARTLHGGSARGPLAGGNLSLVSALEGTPYAIASSNAVLFLEETEEQPYRIDRMLTQLRLSGMLQAASGIVLGQFDHCFPVGPSLTLEQVIDGRVGDIDRPSFVGAPIGHIEEQWVLPIGLEAHLDADSQTLTISESAVSAR